jgi:hypothetical protein
LSGLIKGYITGFDRIVFKGFLLSFPQLLFVIFAGFFFIAGNFDFSKAIRRYQKILSRRSVNG